MAVPVILITGFLGAGKTTLVNQLLKANPDKKISIILNEFGNVKLESEFIEVSGLGMVSELSGGCLCCVANVDLPRVIRYTLEHAPDTEYLLIEASGLSDPDPVRATLTSPALSDLIRLDTVVVVVDADNFARTAPAHPLILSQIAEADYALISKSGSLTAPALDSLVARVSTLGLGTRTFIWTPALDLTLLFDPPLPLTHKPSHAPSHSHHGYAQYYYQSDTPHDINKLAQALTDLPGDILRVKGYSGAYLLQKVGHHVDIRMRNDQTKTTGTVILVLGTTLDHSQLNATFANAKSSQ